MFHYIILLGAAANGIGTFSTIKDTLQGKTKPNRMTWLMWAVAPLIGSLAAWSDGAGWAAIPVFMAGLFALMIFLASFMNPKSYWKMGVLDYSCGVLSILALIFWGMTKEPLIAILFAIASDALASVPTFIKSWKHPETESVLAYKGQLVNALTAFIVIKGDHFSEWAFPIYLILLNVSLIFAVYGGRIFSRRAKH